MILWNIVRFVPAARLHRLQRSKAQRVLERLHVDAKKRGDILHCADVGDLGALGAIDVDGGKVNVGEMKDCRKDLKHLDLLLRSDANSAHRFDHFPKLLHVVDGPASVPDFVASRHAKHLE